jgi:hypothetical protein
MAGINIGRVILGGLPLTTEDTGDTEEPALFL